MCQMPAPVRAMTGRGKLPGKSRPGNGIGSFQRRCLGIHGGCWEKRDCDDGFRLLSLVCFESIRFWSLYLMLLIVLFIVLFL